jgi:drug/metabolite transporter (DMT)-like permease
MGVIFGLAAAVCWGIGDFAITTLARYTGSARSLLYIQIFSLISWVALLGVFPKPNGAEANVWLIAVLAGVFHVFGLVTTYRAFEIGTLSFVSPIASSFAIVTALLMVISGSAPPPIALTGTFLLVAGVAVVSRSTAHDGPVTLRGVPHAICSAIGFGVMFWIIDLYVSKPLGYVYPLIVLKTMATLFAAASVLKSRSAPEEVSAAKPTLAKLAGIAVVAALLDTGAWIAWLFGIGKGGLNGAVVTALASLFSAVTVLLAWIFLKERLSKMQWLGVSVILVGVLLVSLPL